MKKQDLIDAVATHTGMKKTAVAAVLECAFERLAQGVLYDGEASLWSLGKLKAVKRAERSGRNPRTGEEITIPARTAVKFVASKDLDALVNL